MAGQEGEMVKCHTMAEVRNEIDRIDRALVKLLAERLTYIDQAGHIKGNRDTVRDEPRIEDVVAKVIKEGEAAGLPRAMAEPIWRLLIEKSIEHEFVVFDARKDKQEPA
jgi:isochorismate pyruvate lyase